jgi:hypothetical protein
VVGGGVEVVEHVLLVLAAAGLVPGLALLVAAAEPGDREQPARLRPRRDGRRPRRRLRDREAAVARQDAGRVGVGRLTGTMHQEQADLGAVQRSVTLL